MNGEHPEIIGPLYIRPDLEILLEDLSRSEVPMVVATSSSKKRAYWILEKIGIISEVGIKYFSSILTKEDVSKNKPSPEMFLRAKSKLGTPRYCVVIEDSPTGVEAAKNAGMYAIALLTDNYTPEDFSNADLIINNFNELNYQALKKLIENKK
jgi:beta-phosphoglucomutase